MRKDFVPKYPPVTVYDDPVTRTKPEGDAHVVLSIKTDVPVVDREGDPADLIMCTVWFVEDQRRGHTDTYQRWVGRDQLKAVGIKV